METANATQEKSRSYSYLSYGLNVKSLFLLEGLPPPYRL